MKPSLSNWLALLLVTVGLLSGCQDSSGFSALNPSGSSTSTGVFDFSATDHLLPAGFTDQVYTIQFAVKNGVDPVRFTLAKGTFPAGLTLTSYGVLSGRITETPGNFTFTVQATDASGQQTSRELALAIALPFSFLTRSVPDAIVGSAYTSVLSAAGGTSPYTYQVSGLPTGMSFSPTVGLISGTPASVGAYPLQVTTSDAGGWTSTATLTLNVITPVSQNPMIATTSLPSAQVSSPYVAAVIVGGGVLPYHFTVTDGALPSGLNLDGAQGVLSGTATAAGVASFTVQVSDAINSRVSQAYTLTVTRPVAPVISTGSLASGTVGTAYAQVVSASGAGTPFTYSIGAGALPSGLTIDSGLGIIAGTPAAAGPANFTVRVTDAFGTIANKPLSIVVNAPPAPVFTTGFLANGSAGINYVAVIGVTLGVAPYSFSVSAGLLPAGVTLDAGTGILSGIPTAAGNYAFTVKITDNIGSAPTHAYSLTIASQATPTIVTASLPTATTGTSYYQTLLASGGTAPYSFAVTSGTLPAGLILDSASGAISGTPSAAATVPLTFTVTDSGHLTGAKSLSLFVNAAALPQITTNSLPNGLVGSAYTAVLASINGITPYSYLSIGAVLPTGLSLDPNTGVLSGVPTTAGTASLNFRITDSVGGSSTKSLTLLVAAPPVPVVVTAAVANGTINVPYAQVVTAASGVLPYHFVISAGALPTGLSLAGASGIISGSPTVTGTSSFTIEVTDAVGARASQGLAITIASPAAPAITTASLSAASVGVYYAQVITAVGGGTPYSYAVATGALPVGLALGAGTGLVSGTPTAAGTGNFGIRVTDAYGNSTTASFTLTVVAASPPVITTSSLNSVTAGNAFVQVITVAQGVVPYSFSISSGVLPSGLDIDANSGIISGSPTTSGAASFTVRVVDSVGGTATRAYNLSVGAPASPVVTTTSLASGTAGVAYAAVVLASGGSTPYTYAITSGTLPAGMSFDTGNGTLSGTPAAAGSASLVFRVTDNNGSSANRTLTLNIVAAAAPQITSTSMPNGLVGTSYSTVLAGVNGTTPYTFAVSAGTLPAGLSLNVNTGVLSGTPTTAGNASLTFRITDSVLNSSTKSLSVLVVSPSPPQFTTTVLPQAALGSSYAQPLVVSGGVQPYAFSVSAGALPGGLTFSATSGIISGTPISTGTSIFTILVTDNIGATVSQAMTLVVASPAAPTITSTSLSAGAVGASYAQVVSATGGGTPYTYSISVGNLPAGLALSAGTGLISGAPTTAGTSSFTVRVADSFGSLATAVLSIAVTAAPSPVITTSSVAGGTAGTAYVQAISVAQGILPYTFSVSSGLLPSGLALDPNSGILAGIPTAAGISNFTVHVADSVANGANKAYTMIVSAPASPTVTTSSLASGTVGTAYAQVILASGGASPYTYAVTSGTIPAGLSLDGATGTISGTPMAAGSTVLGFRVTDNNGSTANKSLTLNIVAATAPQITTSNLPNGLVGTVYSTVLAGVNGTTPYTFSLTTGTLPGGLTLNANTGVISGTPSAAAAASLTFSIADAIGNFSLKSLTLTVVAPSAPSILTTSLAAATLHSAYAQPLVVTGGVPPYAYSVSAGTLPSGLTLSASSGILSGNPGAVGNTTFTLSVSDGIGATATQSLSLLVNSPAAPTFTTGALSSGTVGSYYAQVVTAVGGGTPYTYSISAGALPAGLAMSPTTGLISGVPSLAGSASFTTRVVDTFANSATVALSIAINAAAVPVITTSSLSNGLAGAVYVQTVTVTQGVLPYAFSISTGTLPTGVALDPNTGILSGTPTSAQSANFTVQVVDAVGGTNSRAYAVTIAAPASPTITTTSLASATVGTAYMNVVIASGGVSPYLFAITSGTLPAGLAFDPSSGTLSGVPTAAATAPLAFRVLDANLSTATRTLILTVVAAAAPQITSVSLPNGLIGTSYSTVLAGVNGTTPYVFSMLSGTLPDGLALNANSGVISGTPTTAQVANLSFRITDAIGNASNKSLSLQIIAPALPSFTTTSLVHGTTTQPYAVPVMVTGGVLPYTFSISAGTLPVWLSLNVASGILSGTPPAAGVSSFTVKVTDGIGAIATQAVSLTVVNPAAPTISTPSLASGTAGYSYMQSLQASGGYSTLTYAIISGTLQSGLSFDTASGTISGVPTASGTATIAFRVTDSLGSASTKSLSLQILAAPAPSISNSSLPSGTQTVAYATVASATGGIGPYSLSVATGSLPAGLALNVSTGVISGTPTTVQTASFSIGVVDALGSTATKALSISIASPAATTISNTTLSGGQVTFAYSQAVIVSGGIAPYTYTVTTGALPTSVTLGAATGAIAGIPTVAGAYAFTVQVLDRVGNTATQAYSVVINPSPYATLALSNSTLLPVMLNTAETRAVTVAGGLPPYAFAITTGAVPAGMSFNGTTGVVSGSATATGTATFTVQVTDARATVVSQIYTLLVSPILSVTTNTLPGAIAGNAYSTTLLSTGGDAPYTYVAAGLPTGIAMTSGGALSGTCNIVGSYAVTVTVNDADGLTAQKTYTLNVAGSLSIVTASVPLGNISAAYSSTIVASGGLAPYAYSLSAGSLPAGLSLNRSTGVISGTPSAGTNVSTTKTSGGFAFTVLASDASGQTATRAYLLPIYIGPRIWDEISNKLRISAVGVYYMDSVRETGGVGSLTWSATGLPTGLSINAVSGFITGIPTLGSAGTYAVAISVRDANLTTTTRTKSLTVVTAGKAAAFDSGVVSNITGTSVNNMVAADLNNDGKPDFVSVSTSTAANNIMVGLNNGDGTFAIYYYSTTASVAATDVLVADVNNDGKKDILILEYTANQIEIISGDNSWTLGTNAHQVIALGSMTVVGGNPAVINPYQMAVGDLNGDGYPDIVVGEYNAGIGSKVMIIMNCGLATTVPYSGTTPTCNNTGNPIINYYAPTPLALTKAYGVGLAALHGGTTLDLVVTNYNSNTAYIYPGTGTGAFGAAGTYTGFVSGSYAGLIRTGFDFNADGKQDVIVEGSDGAYLLLGNGTSNFSTFKSALSSDISTGGFSAAVGDFNGDGFLDLVTIARSSSLFNVQTFLWNSSSSSLIGRRVMNAGGSVVGIAAAKFMSGTTPDILAISSANPSRAVLYQNSGVAPYFNSYASTFGSNGPFFYAAPPAYDGAIHGAPAVGDLNGDGYPDFIVKTGGAAAIYLGGAGPSYTSASTEVGTGDIGANWWFGRQTVLADVNGDGVLDFIAGNYNSNSFGTVSVTLGVGDGTFGAQTFFGTDQAGCTSSGGVRAVGAGDLNKDGIPDLVVGHACNGTARLSIFWGNGDGTYNLSNPTLLAGASGSGYIDNLIVMDVDGDGNADIVAANNNGALQIYRGKGNGTFYAANQTSMGSASNVASLEVGDFNGDGILDYAFSFNSYGTWGTLTGGVNGTANSLTIYSGPTATAGQNFNFVRMVDWDGDGKLDVLAWKYYSGVALYRGSGNGSFTTPTQTWLPWNCSNANFSMPVVSDLNGDGQPDILTTCANGGPNASVGVSYNQSH